MMLSYCIWVGIPRSTKLFQYIEYFRSVVLSFDPKILSTNQIAWFFYIKYLEMA